jgi:hypothetical protein
MVKQVMARVAIQALAICLMAVGLVALEIRSKVEVQFLLLATH